MGLWSAYHAKEIFGTQVLRTGAQTNLLGSSRRVNQLIDTFGADNVSTSIDSFTKTRSLAGCDIKYKLLFKSRDDEVTRAHKRLPGVYVLDKNGVANLSKEIRLANIQNRNLTLREVYQGGSQIEVPNINTLIETCIAEYNKWLFKSRIKIEPFHSLTKKRLLSRSHQDISCQSGCNFQSDCSTKSINLDPNGDLYLCQEASDSGVLKLGNALLNNFDWEMWSNVDKRSDQLHSDCQVCPYLKECRGGCMTTAILEGKGLFGKPDLCALWKAIFDNIDQVISAEDTERALMWLS